MGMVTYVQVCTLSVLGVCVECSGSDFNELLLRTIPTGTNRSAISIFRVRVEKGVGIEGVF